MQGQRSNVDACLMDKVGQLSARNMKLTKLDLDLKRQFSSSLSLDNVRNKSHIFSCCEYELCHEFIKICRKMDYSSKQVKVIEEVIVSSFSVSTEDLCSEMGPKVVDTLYYIAGWTVVALNNIADRRKEDVALPIRYFCNICSIDGNTAKDKGLPTGKVDCVMAFGALTFVNRLYFTFITRLKNIFVQCLSYERLVIYGSFLVERIKNALLNDKIVLSEFALFIHEDVSHIIKTIFVFAVNSLLTNA